MKLTSPDKQVMGTSQRVGAVLLLHGHGRTGRSMGSLARRLEKAGYHSWAPTYRSLRCGLPEIVEKLGADLSLFQAEYPGPLHIVTHSLGGLLARALIHAQRPAHLGRVVMLAPPNQGSEWADLLFRLRLNRLVLGPVGGQLRKDRTSADEAMLGTVDYDLGVIAGDRALDPVFPRLIVPRPNDGKVSVAATRLAGMRDHITLPVSHTFMVNDRRMADQVLAFLADGHFHRV
jgi:pimeloyl-ACP methyl ester carboxylesterase